VSGEGLQMGEKDGIQRRMDGLSSVGEVPKNREANKERGVGKSLPGE